MPPVARFTRESVLQAAFELVRRDGPQSLNARAVARELGGSTQPIFRLFTGMEELHAQVVHMADEGIRSYMTRMASSSRNPYVTVCLSYVLFARDEPQLFKLLFMCDRVSDGACGLGYSHDWGFPVIESSFSVDRDTAVRIYERSFFYAHGLAVCIATKYMPCMSEARMECLVTDNIRAVLAQLGIAADNI